MWIIHCTAGVTLTSELRVPTEFFGLHGHQTLGFAASTRTYKTLGQDPRIITGDVPISQQTGSWAVYWNFDQYLVMNAEDPTKGWGVFGRAGVGDDHTNPLAWFLSFGVGGNSPLRGRTADTFGVGWYYCGISPEIGPLIYGPLGGVGDGQGVELFYNYQLTPWCNITPDLQVIVPARGDTDTALVLGVRVSIAL